MSTTTKTKTTVRRGIGDRARALLARLRRDNDDDVFVAIPDGAEHGKRGVGRTHVVLDVVIVLLLLRRRTEEETVDDEEVDAELMNDDDETEEETFDDEEVDVELTNDDDETEEETFDDDKKCSKQRLSNLLSLLVLAIMIVFRGTGKK